MIKLKIQVIITIQHTKALSTVSFVCLSVLLQIASVLSLDFKALNIQVPCFLLMLCILAISKSGSGLQSNLYFESVRTCSCQTYVYSVFPSICSIATLTKSYINPLKLSSILSDHFSSAGTFLLLPSSIWDIFFNFLCTPGSVQCSIVSQGPNLLKYIIYMQSHVYNGFCLNEHRFLQCVVLSPPVSEILF